MRTRNRLSAAFVKRAPVGKWNDDAGLWPVKREDGGVVRAYRRTDFLTRRHKLADRWADHVTGGAGSVVEQVTAR